MKISVITIVYNDIDNIESTILSVVNQTYKDIEYIIIDGGSTDGTVDVIKKYASHINYWVSESDKGIYDAMNKGIYVATGEWICFMNSGDTFVSDSTIENCFKTPIPLNVGVLYGQTLYKKAGEKKIKANSPLHTISYKTPFCHQSTFIKNNGDKIVFDLKYRIAADYALLYNLYYEKGKSFFQEVNEIVAIYDADDGISKNPKYKYELQKERLKIRNAHRNVRWYYDFIKMTIKILLNKTTL